MDKWISYWSFNRFFNGIIGWSIISNTMNTVIEKIRTEIDKLYGEYSEWLSVASFGE